jgi:hypothetical protein
MINEKTSLVTELFLHRISSKGIAEASAIYENLSRFGFLLHNEAQLTMYRAKYYLVCLMCGPLLVFHPQ